MLLYISPRGVAQFGSASDLGSEGRKFESCRPDHTKILNHRIICGFFVLLYEHIMDLS